MRSSRNAVATAAMVLATGAGGALAQDAEPRLVEPPPTARILRGAPPPSALFGLAPEAPDMAEDVPPGEAVLDLGIRYVDGTIWNPHTNGEDPVRLRAYVDRRDTSPSAGARFVGPTIAVAPGETVRVTLHNELPAEDPSCPPPDGEINTPHCFNRTNLHSHGLWVSPTGNSDNVLIAIDPGVSFQYEYNIPADHPSGTFWYHPHLHGSVALQVSSGMAGFILVRGDRPPTPARNGDIDTLLIGADGQPFPERLVLLQQIQYACYENGAIEETASGFYVCEPGQVGMIENYVGFGPGSWGASGRYTSINGEILPTFPDAAAGRVERWRVAHAGIRDTVALSFRKAKDGGIDAAGIAGSDSAQWIEENCPGPLLPSFSMAEDGLTRAAVFENAAAAVLQPGYRTDLLMIFPEPGEYCVIDAARGPTQTVNRQSESVALLGVVAVGEGESVAPDALEGHLEQVLVEAALANMPQDVRDEVVADLENGLRLSRFVPHPTIEAQEVTGEQTLMFEIDVSSPQVRFLVDGMPYDPARIDRTLVLGGVDQWTLSANPVANHPFHIHVNPFQVVSIRDPNNVEMTTLDDPQNQFYGLAGVWKDTLLISAGYEVTMRTRYERYIGEFVLHCHILDHEDQGMMQNVAIALPAAGGGPSAGAHGGHGAH